MYVERRDHGNSNYLSEVIGSGFINDHTTSQGSQSQSVNPKNSNVKQVKHSKSMSKISSNGALSRNEKAIVFSSEPPVEQSKDE